MMVPRQELQTRLRVLSVIDLLEALLMVATILAIGSKFFTYGWIDTSLFLSFPCSFAFIPPSFAICSVRRRDGVIQRAYGFLPYVA
jgi:hypothetical protein